MEDFFNTIYNIVFPITDLKIYLFICFVILLMFISVMTSRTRIFRTYKKFLKVPNKAGLNGAQIAAASKKVLDIPNLQFALVKGTLTDAYSSKHKTLLMSKDVYESSSLASMAIIAHEFGHALQDKNDSTLFFICKITGKISRIFKKFIFPLIIIGSICMLVNHFGIYEVEFGFPLILLAVVILVCHFLFQLLTIPLEYDASRRGMNYLTKYQFITEAEHRKVKKLLGCAAQTYIASFFDNILPSKK
ncbi:MAG: zinc metallopeptidase [Clostridia bacterium]|nr:zinc metallopeptidase [Clostridia bacterium]